MTPSSSLIFALCCMCLCTGFPPFPDNVTENRLTRELRVCVTGSAILKEKSLVLSLSLSFSLSLYQIEIPGKELTDAVWIMCLLPDQLAVARVGATHTSMTDYNRLHHNLHTMGWMFPGRGWLSRQSASSFHPKWAYKQGQMSLIGKTKAHNGLPTAVAAVATYDQTAKRIKKR